jgi:ComF family protein
VLISYKNGNRSLGPTLAKILINTMTESPTDFPLQLIPIPSSLSKFHKRGYDSITNLCNEMSKLNFDLQVVHGALYLKQEVRDQVGLSARERQENLADAFAATTLLSGPVLIVDDVVTTGATIANAAKALRIAGAQTIYALTLCGSPDSR